MIDRLIDIIHSLYVYMYCMFRLLEDKLLGMRREVTTMGFEEKKITLFAWLVGWVGGWVD